MIMTSGSFLLLLCRSCLKFYTLQSKLLSVLLRPLSAGLVPRSGQASGPEPHPGLLQGVSIPVGSAWSSPWGARIYGVLPLNLRGVARMPKEAVWSGIRARGKESERSLTNCGNAVLSV